MKALIIGAAGFVGGHLIEYLHSVDDLEVYATKLSNENIASRCINKENILDLDILDKGQVDNLLGRVRPDYIFHLAAQSSVSLSWKEPTLTYRINVVGTINVLESIRMLQLRCRTLLIGSAEQYGAVGEGDLPVKESLSVKPSNPYAVSKASQEMMAQMYVNAYNMDIVMVRAFNHIGPGQSPVFVISDFARQIAKIEKGLKEPVIHVGNLTVKRDFSDVRDIVRGYWQLMQKGVNGEVYNIGSGRSYIVAGLLDEMIKMSGRDIEVVVDQNKFRPADIKELRADIGKINDHVLWQPEIGIETSLLDILGYWRTEC